MGWEEGALLLRNGEWGGREGEGKEGRDAPKDG